MTPRKRIPLKPKTLPTQNGSTQGENSSQSRAKSSDSVNSSDLSLYLRLSILILLILAVGGFLLYPDILNIVKAVHEKSFNNNKRSENLKESQTDTLFTNTQSSPKQEKDIYDEAVLDDEAGEVSLFDDTNEEDLMEDEEADNTLEQMKPSQAPKILKANASTETKTKNNRISPTDKEPNNKRGETSKDKTTNFDANSKQNRRNKPEKDKTVHTTGPIKLTAENNHIVLDQSQIKFVDSASSESVNTKHDHAKKTKGASQSQKTEKGQMSSNKEVKFEKQKNNKVVDNKIENLDDVAEEAKKFNSTFHKTFTPKKIFADGRRIPPVELLHQKESNSSVRVFLFDDFLSQQECDGLIKAHDSHVKALDKPPILCFDSITTLKKHIKEVKKNINVTPNDFTKGTKCVNASFSLQLQSWLKGNWSYSTAFYPGESTFSKVIANRIKEAMGLDPASGGKFQITSYPEGKAYKEHTDCTLGGVDKRDRVVSVMAYLSNVEEGGETTFPELGIWVRPKKARAIVWNNMSPDGVCEEHSKHIASVVKKGSKYILIRWYYYKTFYSLGRRPPPPHLPEREPGQPMVNCDEYNSGSCRWYDEWSYEPLVDYEKNRLKLI